MPDEWANGPERCAKAGIPKNAIVKKTKIALASVRGVRLQLIALLKNEGVHLEKEIDKMLFRHGQRINDINRYYPDKDYFKYKCKLTK